MKIEKFALGGQGLAFVEYDAEMDTGKLSEEGKHILETQKRRVPVFVDDVCVGDEADVRVAKKKKSFAEGRAIKITKPSDERVKPRCKHFGVCGGCTWQFLSYEKQLKWKEQLVRETLGHIGGFTQETLSSIFQGITGCDDPWNYRNKMEWSFSLDPRGELSGGFHVRRMHYDTVNVEECFLQSDMSVKIFKKVREYFEEMRRRGINVTYNSKVHRGLVHSVYVREGKRTGEYMVIIQTTPEEFDTEAFVAMLRSVPEFSCIVSIAQIVVHEQKGTPKRWEERVLFGQEFYREELWLERHAGENDADDSQKLTLQFQVKPQAFFQPNTLMAEKIYGQVLHLLQDHFPSEKLSTMRAYDLYCGTGTIGIVLSHAVKSVVGVELNPSGVASAKENAQTNRIENIEFFVGDVKKVLEDLASTHDADVIVVDPPRSGLEEKVVQQIITASPEAILYVSCNPATFSRDAKIFSEQGYALAFARAFDQFPHTAHIETVALLKKR